MAAKYLMALLIRLDRDELTPLLRNRGNRYGIVWNSNGFGYDGDDLRTATVSDPSGDVIPIRGREMSTTETGTSVRVALQTVQTGENTIRLLESTLWRI